MRVLYLLHTTDLGGSTISFLSMVSGVKANGFDVLVLGPTPKQAFVDRIDRLGVAYINVPVVESIYPNSHSIKDLFFFFPRILNLLRRKRKSQTEIERIVKRYKPDIIHTNVGTIHEGFIVSKRLAIPHIWHLREYQDKDFGWRVFPNKTCFENKLKGSYVVTITNDIMIHFGLQKSDKAKVIYNGIYPKRKTDYLCPKDKFFLCTSRISPEKGIREVIDAFSLFYQNHREYKLIILGEGDSGYMQSLKDQSAKLGCGGAVVFEGYKDDVYDYMKRATALVVASKFEGFGRMTAEACFAGCLVIGRNTGGTKEILEYTGGVLFDTIDELYKGMLSVVSFPGEAYQRMALLAQQRATAAYSVESNIDSICGLYRQIIGVESI